MHWKITWGEVGYGVAVHETGASFHVSRTRWIVLRDASGQSEEKLHVLAQELHEILANVAEGGDVIH